MFNVLRQQLLQINDSCSMFRAYDMFKVQCLKFPVRCWKRKVPSSKFNVQKIVQCLKFIVQSSMLFFSLRVSQVAYKSINKIAQGCTLFDHFGKLLGSRVSDIE